MALEQLSRGAGKCQARAGRWAMTDATDQLVLGVEVEYNVFGGLESARSNIAGIRVSSLR